MNNKEEIHEFLKKNQGRAYFGKEVTKELGISSQITAKYLRKLKMDNEEIKSQNVFGGKSRGPSSNVYFYTEDEGIDIYASDCKYNSEEVYQVACDKCKRKSCGALERGHITKSFLTKQP